MSKEILAGGGGGRDTSTVDGWNDILTDEVFGIDRHDP